MGDDRRAMAVSEQAMWGVRRGPKREEGRLCARLGQSTCGEGSWVEGVGRVLGKGEEYVGLSCWFAELRGPSG